LKYVSAISPSGREHGCVWSASSADISFVITYATPTGAPAFVAVLLFAPTTRKLDPSAKARNPADTPPLGSERPQTFNDQLTLHRINVLIAQLEFRKATLHPAQE
jgi:hypothetical protein